jgi:ankyrin repeat protein
MTITAEHQSVIDAFVGSAHGDFDAVRALLSEHPEILNEPASWGERAIEAAAQMGRPDIAEYLLAQGAPLTTATAVMLGRLDDVERQLAGDPAGANARGAHGLSLLYHAVAGNQPAVTELLLARGADPNAGGTPDGEPVPATPLHGAAMFNRAMLASLLLERGANPGLRNGDGETPLALAEKLGHAETAAVLRDNTPRA